MQMIHSSFHKAVLLVAVILLSAGCGRVRAPFRPVPSSLDSLGMTSTGIPVISIETEGGKEVLNNKEYVNCSVNIYNVEGRKALTDVAAGIRLRGNSSRFSGNIARIRENPVPYRLKFDKKVNLLGLNAGAQCRNWILLTNRKTEKDVIKNDFALRFGRMIMASDGVYCSDAQLAHLYLNGRLQGAYLVCEQNQVHPERINICDPQKGYAGTDIGYLVEIDSYGEEPCFMMDYENAMTLDINGTLGHFEPKSYSIKSDTYSEDQKEFISNYIRGVFKIVYEACEKKNFLAFDGNYAVGPSGFKNAEECVGAVLDLPSVIDMYILYELLCDKDVGESSFFMCADFSGKGERPKLAFTAPWDFNWTWERKSNQRFFAAAFTPGGTEEFGERSNPWFILLYKQKWFRDRVRAKWRSLGGSNGVARCIALENAYISLYRPDMDRRTPGIMDEADLWLQWVQMRADWLETRWGDNN